MQSDYKPMHLWIAIHYLNKPTKTNYLIRSEPTPIKWYQYWKSFLNPLSSLLHTQIPVWEKPLPSYTNTASQWGAKRFAKDDLPCLSVLMEKLKTCLPNPLMMWLRPAEVLVIVSQFIFLWYECCFANMLKHDAPITRS